jgi:peptide deformylase
MKIEPTALKLVTFPAPVLRKKAAAVDPIDDTVRAVAKAMVEIMYESEGIGLAAPQVGVSWRMFVVDIPPTEERTAVGTDTQPPSATNGPVVYINPVLSKPYGAVEPYEEGCLSLPDVRGDVLRPPTITITAQDESGRTFTHTATGLLARCWQHEFDHLNGVLILDKMTMASRHKARKAIKALEEDD